MKLRIRSAETKETIRVEVADSASLLDLKTLIAGKLSSSSSSSSSSSPPISPQFIALSLNRTEELVSSSPSAPLPSLGLTSGDLLFFSRAPNPFSPPAQNPSPDPPPAETLASDPPQQEEEEEMEVETEPAEEAEEEKSPSVPCFLKRVMELEKHEIEGNNLAALVVAVHAVFLESGFAACDGDGSRLPKGWNLRKAAVSIRYTVPELLGKTQEDGVKQATLKFQVMNNHVSVYGSLIGESDVYRLYLNLAKVVPSLALASDRESGEEELFKFWKTVKDRLCLPLLIDICMKNGLPLPPSFVRLPTDLKVKILELLPGVDVATIECTCSEMRYLASNEELWKQKFVEEFGRADEREVASPSSWKEKFKRRWIRRRDAEKTMREMQSIRHYQRRFMPRYPPFAPQRFPHRFPVIGGDYDLFPGIGNFSPTGAGFGYPRRNFSPHCNLGVGDNFDSMG